MGHYLIRASYTQQGIQGVLKEGGTARANYVKGLVESLGGSVEVAYWALGADDFILVAELADNATAAAISTRVSASGAASVSTTPLLTPADIDAAAAINVEYRPPGS